MFNPNQPRDSHGRFGEIAGEALSALSHAAGAAASTIIAHVGGKGYKVFKPGPRLDTYHDDPTVPHLSSVMGNLHRDALGGKNLSKYADALLNYTNFGYRGLQEALRNAKGNDAALTEYYRSWTHKLDAAVSAGKMPYDAILHRGVGPIVNQMLQPNAEVQDLGFKSATLNRSYAEMFRMKPRNVGGATLHLLVKKGATALPMHNLSSMPEEYEVLFPRGSRYKVLHRQDHDVFAELL